MKNKIYKIKELSGSLLFYKFFLKNKNKIYKIKELSGSLLTICTIGNKYILDIEFIHDDETYIAFIFTKNNSICAKIIKKNLNCNIYDSIRLKDLTAEGQVFIKELAKRLNDQSFNQSWL